MEQPVNREMVSINHIITTSSNWIFASNQAQPRAVKERGKKEAVSNTNVVVQMYKATQQIALLQLICTSGHLDNIQTAAAVR